MSSEHEERLDAVFSEGFDSNDPIILDWEQIKIDLKRLRKIENDLICGKLSYVGTW